VELARAEVPQILPLLDSPHHSVREECRDLLSLWTRQEFLNAAAAQTWWEKHQNRFDSSMAEITAE
jgi:phage baseplate assembly protein gpV